MKQRKKNGFALVLSLVLLMVMSLMGGSLVVVSSSDHRSNNHSDEYQQAFYVAETGLLEAEKYLSASFMGLDKREINNGTETNSKDVSQKGKPPKNLNDVNQTDCYKSFKNIINLSKVVAHHRKGSFFNIIEQIFEDGGSDRTGTDTDKTREKDHLQKFTYEYFMVNVGKANFNEAGSSISKGSLDVINAGTAYRIYSCGIFDDDKVIIPLESIVVLPG